MDHDFQGQGDAALTEEKRPGDDPASFHFPDTPVVKTARDEVSLIP